MKTKTKTVGELIKELEKYSDDTLVYYSTKYALTPFAIRYSSEGDCLMLEMSKEYLDLLSNEE